MNVLNQENEVVSILPAEEPKAGHKTTEFYMAIVGQVIMLLVAGGLLTADLAEELVGAIGAAVAALVALIGVVVVVVAYIRSRTAVKVQHEKLLEELVRRQ
jgi:hypothetical protein